MSRTVTVSNKSAQAPMLYNASGGNIDDFTLPWSPIPGTIIDTLGIEVSGLMYFPGNQFDWVWSAGYYLKGVFKAGLKPPDTAEITCTYYAIGGN